MHLTIRFHTAANVPAPFCHEVLIHFQIEKQGLHTHFQMAYFDREDLEEEEILEEGFTLNDDVEWKGTLHQQWATALQKVWEKTPKNILKIPPKAHENYLEIEVNSEFNGRPANFEQWEHTLQELIQAVFETSGKERFLQLKYKEIAGNQTIDKELCVYFKDRSAKLTLKPTQQTKPLAWDTAQKLISLIFIGEFIPDNTSQRNPTHKGKFIDIGDGLWYELGKSLKNPSGNKQFLTQLEKAWEI